MSPPGPSKNLLRKPRIGSTQCGSSCMRDKHNDPSLPRTRSHPTHKTAQRVDCIAHVRSRAVCTSCMRDMGVSAPYASMIKLHRALAEGDTGISYMYSVEVVAYANSMAVQVCHARAAHMCQTLCALCGTRLYIMHAQGRDTCSNCLDYMQPISCQQYTSFLYAMNMNINEYITLLPRLTEGQGLLTT